ncbi:MAG: ATP-binding protein [Okeania sp. SIO3I5]|uniref:AAA family ATPase n=1 Tax=Okeania sp. SIO3I5 TaxID=2607805 RepID=UPI0013BB8212|nr:ATP-binding protein [Okeania sp. SIO3I5]NEQ39857.1 ATP-binding protein [Okeania sp. SIO3I5]
MPPNQQFFPDTPVPPEKFVGRTSELYTLFDKINSRGHVAIYGSSGMGKTSLLKYVQSPNFWEEKGLDFSKALIVYHNCEASFTIDNFWRKVLEELKNEAENDEDIQAKINNVLDLETIEIIDIRPILRKIGEKDKFFLLLLDDYHGIVGTQEEYVNNLEKSREMETFVSELRNLAVHNIEGQYFSTIVTTFQKLHELGPTITRAGSPWYNHYSYLPLKPFIPEDIDEYFFESNGDFFSLIFENIQKEKVLEMTGGYPGLLQCVGDIFSRFDPVDIDTLNTKLKDYADRTFQDIWRNFEKNEQEILKLIAIDNSKGKLRGKSYSLHGINKDFIRYSSILDNLEKKGLIYQLEQTNKYNFYSSLMKDFVGKQLEDKNVSIAEDREILMILLNIKITRGRWKQIKEKIQPIINLLQPLARIFNFIANRLPGK